MNAVRTVGTIYRPGGASTTTYAVMTEDGQTAMIDVTRQLGDSYGFELSGELIDAAPEAITAALGLVLRAIHEQRAG